MIVLTAADVERLLPMGLAVESCKQALAMHAAGETTVPLRTNIPVPAQQGASALFMPASVPGLNTIGIKIVSHFPGNAARGLPVVPGQVLVFDGETGMLQAIMDGTSLTRIRTGAVQGAATDLLARADAQVGALIGCGGQAGGQLAAMLEVRDLREVRVSATSFAKAQAFAAEQAPLFNGCEIVPCRDAAEAVRGADVVTAVTSAKDAVFDGDAIAAGCHVNGIGSFTPEMAEIPDSLVARADRIFVDTQDCLAESGDIIGPIERGIIRAEDCLNLGDLVNGSVTGRADAQQITLFNSVGSAVLDVVCADAVLRAAREQGIGTQVAI
ncbi:ornithine cyclodeaminase family protein [Dermabacteraceae bacterium CCM 9519]